jgi:hypothetical protein
VADHTISIPDSLYEKARQVAQQTARQVDEVIRARLTVALDEPFFDLPVAERDELKAMQYLSDAALLNMLRAQMPRTEQDRLAVLLTRNTHGTITPDEAVELAAWVGEGERLTLRKATAMDILMDRGHTLTLEV